MIAAGLLFACNAITALVRGNNAVGENYLGQPTGPGLQLIAGIVLLAVGSFLAWEYLHPKPESKGKKHREKQCYLQYPHEKVP